MAGGFFITMDNKEWENFKDFMPDGPCKNFDTCTCGDCKDCPRYDPIKTLAKIFDKRVY